LFADELDLIEGFEKFLPGPDVVPKKSNVQETEMKKDDAAV
jgi:hypothetical protein